jgi:TPR repeat protein
MAGSLDVTPEELRALTAEAKRGDVAMQNVLGAVLYRRHDLDGAEQWWRAAALGGHDEAAFNLGCPLQ